MIWRSLFRRLFHRKPANGGALITPGRDEAAPASLIEAARRLADERHFDQARHVCDEIIGHDPGDEKAWLLLSRIHKEQGNPAAAKAALDKVIELYPNLAEAYFLRGKIFQARRALKSALRDYLRAAEIDPLMIKAHTSQGAVHYLLDEFEKALECTRRVLRLDPDNVAASLNQGLMLRELGCAEDAENTLRRAVARHPGDHDARCGLAMVMIDQGRFEEAEQHLNTVLTADPSHNEACWLLGVAGLARGRFREGWQHYGSRLRRGDAEARPYGFPEWDGTRQPGTVLVYAEQALGDDILFASCIPDVMARVAHCVIECEPRLAEIFRRSFPAATVHGSKHKSQPVWLAGAPAVSAQIAAGSLPGLFRNEWADFPHHQGYLVADTNKVHRWRARLAALGPGLKVGIAWTGGAVKTRRRIRSIALSELLPVLGVPGAQFVSLQYVESVAEIDAISAAYGRQVHHWQEAIADYDETAALVTALDLVISVCTAVVHLSGALGKQVWVMAPSSPEWRYLRTGDRLPWYPSARVFRQQRAGDWSPVIASVAAEIERQLQS